MDSVEVITIVREGIWVLILVSAPLMITALVVGLTVSSFKPLRRCRK